MPSYQNHLLFGSVIALLFSYIGRSFVSFSPGAVVLTSVLILLASVFPDIDHSGAVVHRKLKGFIFLFLAVLHLPLTYPEPVAMVAGVAAAAAITLILFRVVKPKHRTVTHSFSAAVSFSAISGLVALLSFKTVFPAVFAFLAYYSHIALDRFF